MEKDKSILKNYIYNLSYQLLTILLPVVTVPYISRVLRPTGLGLYSYSSAIVSYFVLLGGLGFSFYGSKVIAVSRDNSHLLKQYFWEIFILRLVTISIFASIYIFWVFEGNNQHKVLYLYQGLGLFASLFDITYFFSGLEEFRKIVLRNFIVKILSLILIFCFVRDSGDLLIYTLIVQGSILIGNLTLVPYLREYGIFKLNIGFLKGLNFKRNILPSIQLFIPLVSIQVYTVLNKVMLGHYIGSTEVAYYDNATKIVTLVLTVLTSLGTIMFPRFSYYFAMGMTEKIRHQFNLTLRLNFLVSIGLIVFLIGINTNFVLWFFGEEYIKISSILPLLALSILPISLASIAMTQYLVPSGKNKTYTISVITGAIINVLLNLILIKRYGIIGVALSYVISETIVSIIQLFGCKSIISFTENIASFLSVALSGIITLIALEFENNKILPLIKNNYLFTFIQLPTGLLVFILVLLIFKNKEVKYIFSKFHLSRFSKDFLR
ncbi:flippase [Heyndrickxia coagulans]|uniref:flippase n=1 Tax=Heyndrickxia coagulans TaxID=1398 RepID=UPI0007796DD2|nr:flippase [Heyndrickxia coagulans]KYC63714.1 hypothetical protein B4100_0932 [Heyndrickxia coagulans]MED4313615.1 flippase [Heyndrickxia coagulans]UZH05022.1 flippase [Heyndrickxia coagulans]